MMVSDNPVRIAQVGYGYWGPNLTRNFHQLPTAELAYIVDANPDALARAGQLYPYAQQTANFADVLADDSVDALSIATPAHSHYTLVREALTAGKHVLIEKPLTMDVAEGEALVKLADEQQLTLMVGHVFEYNSAVRYIKEALQQGALGDLYYLYSRRVNLGRVQSDINALWSIAPHDISIALYLLEMMPEAVSCQGASCLNGLVEDVIFLTLHFPGDILCHIHVSWLDPSKTREMTVVGSRRMIVYDDVSAEGKIRVYDKGVYRKGDPIYGEFQYKLHSGDILIPKVDMREPLQEECRHFIDCINTKETPLTDGRNGLRVVKILTAGQHSLDHGGDKVLLDATYG